MEQVFSDLTVELKEQLSFDSLGQSEQARVLDDLGRMHSAAESAYFSIISENDGEINTDEELLRTIVARVTENKSGEDWYGSLMNRFGAERLEDIVESKLSSLK